MLKVTEDKTEDRRSKQKLCCRDENEDVEDFIRVNVAKSHVPKVVENSQVFLIFTCSYDPLIGTRKHVFKKIVNGYVFILFGCVCRARTSTRDDHACACVWSCSIFRKNLFFLSKFLPKKNWKSIYLWVPFRCWRKDFWKILAVHCKTAPIFFFVCLFGSFSVLFLPFH